MSSLILTGDTSGTITLAAPAVAGTHTLTMPVATGTAVLEDASGVLQINSGYGSVAPAYGCRAWVNFNGSGTVAIRGSGNVSSITDNSTGNYTVNFATDMPDTNYSAVQGYTPASSNCYVTRVSTLTVSSVRMGGYLNYANGSALDMSMVAVAVFR
jgi:hypothetical protein